MTTHAPIGEPAMPAEPKTPAADVWTPVEGKPHLQQNARSQAGAGAERGSTMSQFDEFIDRVLSAEGGYVNDPADPGGETRYGISKRAYPNVDIKALTRDASIELYRRDFWQRVHGDELPGSFAFQALDAAVNHGVENAVRWMQRAAGVADDGHFGPLTLAAVLRAQPCDMVLSFNAIRLRFYSKLARFDVFGRGWINRVAANLDYAAQDN